MPFAGGAGWYAGLENGMVGPPAIIELVSQMLHFFVWRPEALVSVEATAEETRIQITVGMGI